MPITITSDRGLQFTSNLLFQLCKMLIFHTNKQQLITLSPTMHCRLKDAIRACAAAATWSEELPFVLLGLGAQPREDTGLSPG